MMKLGIIDEIHTFVINNYRQSANKQEKVHKFRVASGAKVLNLTPGAKMLSFK